MMFIDREGREDNQPIAIATGEGARCGRPAHEAGAALLPRALLHGLIAEGHRSPAAREILSSDQAVCLER